MPAAGPSVGEEDLRSLPHRQVRAKCVKRGAGIWALPYFDRNYFHLILPALGRRRGTVFVYCEKSPKHKQRQGLHSEAQSCHSAVEHAGPQRQWGLLEGERAGCALSVVFPLSK